MAQQRDNRIVCDGDHLRLDTRVYIMCWVDSEVKRVGHHPNSPQPSIICNSLFSRFISVSFSQCVGPASWRDGHCNGFQCAHEFLE